MARRRPSGEGMIRQKKKGQWEGRVVVGHKENGEAKTFSCTMKMNIYLLWRDFLSSASMGAKKNPQIS